MLYPTNTHILRLAHHHEKSCKGFAKYRPIFPKALANAHNIYDISYMKEIIATLQPLTLFKCLAEETRLTAMQMMLKSGELCVCELTDALGLSQPKVSRHLAELKKCGLVQDCRRGKWVYYRLNDALPEWALAVLRESAAPMEAELSGILARLPTANTASACC